MLRKELEYSHSGFGEYPYSGFIKNISHLREKRILDIGAGGKLLEQTYSHHTSKRRTATNFFGIDNSYTALPPEVFDSHLYSTADAKSLPFPNESFDIVAMMTLLDLLRSARILDQALNEAWRMMVPGGLLLAGHTVLKPKLKPDLDRLKQEIEKKAIFIAFDAYRYKRAIKKSGFRIKSQEKEVSTTWVQSTEKSEWIQPMTIAHFTAIKVEK